MLRRRSTMTRTTLDSLVLRGSVVVGGTADVRLGTNVRGRTAYPTDHPNSPCRRNPRELASEEPSLESQLQRTGRSLAYSLVCSWESRSSRGSRGRRIPTRAKGIFVPFTSACTRPNLTEGIVGHRGRTPAEAMWDQAIGMIYRIR